MCITEEYVYSVLMVFLTGQMDCDDKKEVMCVHSLFFIEEENMGSDALYSLGNRV